MAAQAVAAPRATARALAAPGAAAWSAAGLSLLAAWIHFAYTASHWRDWWAYGLFFVAMGVFQALCVPAILRWPRSTWVAVATIAGNLGIVGMYFYSRAIYIPLGPHYGVVEDIGVIDFATTAGEILIVGIMLALTGARSRRVIVNLLLLTGIALWLLRLTNLLA